MAFTSFDEFDESDICAEYEDRPEDCFELIEKNITTPKVAFEFYVRYGVYNSNINQSIIARFLNEHNIDIDTLYDLPTDSNKPTTLLNCFCEYRYYDEIKFTLEAGASPNVPDACGFTAFQSLIVGHSAGDNGRNALEVKNTIELLLAHSANLKLEQWQKEECYESYVEQDIYYKDLLDKITVVENTNE